MKHTYKTPSRKSKARPQFQHGACFLASRILVASCSCALNSFKDLATSTTPAEEDSDTISVLLEIPSFIAIFPFAALASDRSFMSAAISASDFVSWHGARSKKGKPACFLGSGYQ